jgi:hypothetical protein
MSLVPACAKLCFNAIAVKTRWAKSTEFDIVALVTKRVGTVKTKVVTVLILVLFLAYVFSNQAIPDGLDGYIQSLADKIRSAVNWIG